MAGASAVGAVVTAVAAGVVATPSLLFSAAGAEPSCAATVSLSAVAPSGSFSASEGFSLFSSAFFASASSSSFFFLLLNKLKNGISSFMCKIWGEVKVCHETIWIKASSFILQTAN